MSKLKSFLTAAVCSVMTLIGAGAPVEKTSGGISSTYQNTKTTAPGNSEYVTHGNVVDVAQKVAAAKRSVEDEAVYVKGWNFSAFEKLAGTGVRNFAISDTRNPGETNVVCNLPSLQQVAVAKVELVDMVAAAGGFDSGYSGPAYKVISVYETDAGDFSSILNKFILKDKWVAGTDSLARKSDLNSAVTGIDLGAKRDKTDELVYSQTEVDWDFSELTKIDPTKLYSIRTEMDSDGGNVTYTYWLDRRISGGGGSLIELEKHPDDASVSNENLTRFVIKRVVSETVDAAFKPLIGTIIYKRGVVTGDTLAHESEKADAETTSVYVIADELKVVINGAKGLPIRNLSWYYSKGTVGNIKVYNKDTGALTATASNVSDWDGSVPSFIATFRYGDDNFYAKISATGIKFQADGDTWTDQFDFTRGTRVAKDSKKLDGHTYEEVIGSIKLTDNITPTKTVGNVTAGTEIQCAGKSIQWMFEQILAQDIQPSAVAPSITSLSLTEKLVEVGTTVAPYYTIGASLGSYTYGVTNTVGSTATKCSWSKFVLTDNADVTYEVAGTATSGNLESFVVTDSTNFKLTKVVGTHTAGDIPQTYNKKVATVAPIPAGTKDMTQNTSTISGYRQYFVFVGSKATAITSDILRNVVSGNRGNAKVSGTITKAITIGSGVTRFAVALPAGDGYSKTLKKAVNGATGYNEFSFFAAPITVSVAGATAGYNMNYNVYIWDRSDTEGPFEPTTFTLTIE